MITNETRAHLMAARDDVFRAGDGHPSVNLALVALHIDHALRSLCPHLPVTWKTSPDTHGRDLTTCYACAMSWYSHDNDPSQESYAVAREHAAYMSSLEQRLQSRAAVHGFAYVTPGEGERLQANGLYQPGHTIHRFSPMSEDRSDAVLEEQERVSVLRREQATARKVAENRALTPGSPTGQQGWTDRTYTG